MQYWQKKRESKLADLTLGAHILAYLIAVSIFISSNLSSVHDFQYFAVLLISFLIPVAIFILLDYYFLQGKNSYSQTTILAWNIIKHIVLFAMITTFFFSYGGEYLWLLSALYILPLVLSCITLGRRWGMVFAGAAVVIIFILSLDADFTARSQAAETVLVLGGIFFLVAWLLGGIMDVETKTTAGLASMANRDSLTGLGNHRFFHEQLSRALEKAIDEQEPCSLVLVDIDHFKQYNKNYGHTQGDLLLQEIAGLLRSNTPSSATLSRLNSDIFAIILPHTDLEKANTLASRINQAAAEHNYPGEISQPYEKISVSSGVANFPYHVLNAQELLDTVDEALYSSKSTGRNQVRIYHAVLERLSRTAEGDDRDLINSLRTLMTVINGKDRYTYGHSERVANFAKMVGKRLGLNSQELRLLEFGAFLHDLGKLEIPREILNKNETLSNSEWNIIQRHPVWGAEILKPIHLLQPVIPMILHHHENYDGSGYPEGLTGKKIPLPARVLRVVDSYDAITSSRPYRSIMTRDEAIAEIVRLRGVRYDPLVVDVFTTC